MVFYQSIGPFTPLKKTLNLQNYHEIKVQSVKPHDLFLWMSTRQSIDKNK